MHSLFVALLLAAVSVRQYATAVSAQTISTSDAACYMYDNASAAFTSIALLPSGRWGSQPSFMANRPLGPTTDALTAMTLVEYPVDGDLPAVYVQGMTSIMSFTSGAGQRTSAAVNPLYLSAALRSQMNVAYRFESLDVPPQNATAFQYVEFNADVVAAVRANVTQGPFSGRWVLAMYLANLSTMVNGSALVPSANRLVSLPLNVTRGVGLPSSLSFAKRLVVNGTPAYMGRPFPTFAQLLYNTTGLVQDERTPAVSYEGNLVTATVGNAVRPFEVIVGGTTGAPMTNYAVRLQYYDSVVKRFSTTGLVNHTVAISAVGRALFTDLRLTSALGSVTILVTVIDKITTNVLATPPIAFQLQVFRVLLPIARLTFLKRRNSEALYLPASRGSGFSFTASPLAVIPNTKLPTIMVAIIDSNGTLNEQVSGVMRATATGAGTLTSGVLVSIVGGIATFDTLMLGADAVVDGHVTLTFSLAILSNRGGSIAGVPGVQTLPLRIISGRTAVTWLDLSPGNTQFPHAGASATVRVQDVLPPIAVILGHAVDAQYSDQGSGLTARVECSAVAFDGVTNRSCGLSGATSRTFTGGFATFDDLQFTTLPIGEVARLEFFVEDSQTPSDLRSVASRGYRVSTGLIRVLARFGTPLVVNAAFFAGANGVFWGELGSSPVLLDTLHAFPVTVVQLLGLDGTVQESENEVAVQAQAAGGSCVMHNGVAFAYRGRAFFKHMRVSDCEPGVSAIRIKFTVGPQGTYNRAEGITLLTGPVILLPTETTLGSLRVDTETSAFLRHADVAIVGGGNIPALRVGLYPSSFGAAPRLNTAANGLAQAGLQASPSTTVISTVVGAYIVPLQRGRATFSGLRLSLDAGIISATISFCVEGLVLPCMNKKLIVKPSTATTSMIINSPVPWTQPSNDSVRTTTGNMTVAVAFGQYSSADASWVQADVTPVLVQNRYVTLRTSEPLSAANSNGSAISTVGVANITGLRFSDPPTVLTDGVLTVEVTTPFVPVGAGVPASATMFPPLSPTRIPAAQDRNLALTFHVLRPLRLFNIDRWRRDVASHFQIAPTQLVVERVGDATLTTQINARTTKVELRIMPARPQDPLKRDVRLIAGQMLHYQESCDQLVMLDIGSVRLTGSPPPSANGCDATSLQEWTESARHCEAVRGVDVRCACFEHMFITMGRACSGDAQMKPLCSYLSACRSATIKDVCSEVVDSLVLRVVLVVGGTTLALVVITLIVKLNTSHSLLKRGKTLTQPDRTSRGQGIKQEDQHFDDVFIM
jgi:hypothetical protein